MSAIFYVTLFLALGLCNASIDSGYQLNKGMDSINEVATAITVSVQINLPLTSKKVHFNCLEGGLFEVAFDKSFDWAATAGEKCKLRFINLRTSIDPRDSNDGGRLSYWLIKLDGLYQSSDKQSWVKKAEWNTDYYNASFH
ncbi:unnamed protein product [Lupinus luteus]|uniref:S-protein homolog n=1 Tax=Lupinus luteus TaxID=3873 RepID=A0AAV1WZ12_LUPLU